jgi:hypothetical protein
MIATATTTSISAETVKTAPMSAEAYAAIPRKRISEFPNSRILRAAFEDYDEICDTKTDIDSLRFDKSELIAHLYNNVKLLMIEESCTRNPDREDKILCALITTYDAIKSLEHPSN